MLATTFWYDYSRSFPFFWRAGFGGRDLVGRDLVACSRFWGRDRVATAVVRGASPFWKSSFVRATNRHGRDHRQICRSPLVLSVGHAEWRKHPGANSLVFQAYPAPPHGRANAPTCAFPDRLWWAVPCRGARALRCKHRLRCRFRCRFLRWAPANSTTRRRRVV